MSQEFPISLAFRRAWQMQTTRTEDLLSKHSMMAYCFQRLRWEIHRMSPSFRRIYSILLTIVRVSRLRFKMLFSDAKTSSNQSAPLWTYQLQFPPGIRRGALLMLATFWSALSCMFKTNCTPADTNLQTHTYTKIHVCVCLYAYILTENKNATPWKCI